MLVDDMSEIGCSKLDTESDEDKYEELEDTSTISRNSEVSASETESEWPFIQPDSEVNHDNPNFQSEQNHCVV